MIEQEIVVLMDYQREFEAACEETVTFAVIDELSAAMRRHAVIVVVEFDRFGETDPRVKETLDGYDKLVVCHKNTADGSFRIVEELISRGFVLHREAVSSVRFRMFGVETNVCVYHSAKGLATEYGAAVDVVKRACNQAYNKQEWWPFERLDNVCVVA